MPQLTVEEIGTFTVPQDKRLVLALEDEAGIDQLHACGGVARCTTCRVQFVSGEPTRMTDAERAILTTKGLLSQPGLRLSCQLQCTTDMTIRVISRLKDTPTRADTGRRPAEEITPPAVWQPK